MINVDTLSRAYGDFIAVSEVSFTISQGEIVGLLGHNGAGKTTIMKMLTGYLEPTSGSAAIDGRDVVAERRAVQRMIGYLPENCPLYPEMTVIDYLDYCAALRGIAAADRSRCMAEAIHRTGLAERASWPIAKLSRGYRQRVGVAQAILHNPPILILDEPTNGLDPNQIQQMRALISELASQSTVIISTHILQEVQAVCNRVIIMKDGRKALDAKLAELHRDERLLITVSAAPETAEPVLQKMAGVAEVENAPSAAAADAGGQSYLLTLTGDCDKQQTAAAIAARVHDLGWQLYGLQFASRSLETVFAEISA